MTARMLYLHALSPIHSGTGQASDVIDLPVAREKVTNWPYLAGSRLKGVLRDACAEGRSNTDPLLWAAFGPDTQNASLHAGALTFTDAHLLCLPVRSLYGTFAWVTCPLALRRWRRDHEAAGLAPAPEVPSVFRFRLPSPPNPLPANRPSVAMLAWEPNMNIQIAAPLGTEWVVYLEDLDLLLKFDEEVLAVADAIAAAVFGDSPWASIFKQRFGIVPDDIFTFLTDTATEVVARIQLRDDAKTVENLWYEEALPSETILAGPVLSPTGTPARTGDFPAPAYTDAELLGLLAVQHDEVIQIGGGASVGRGLVRMRLDQGEPS